MLKPAELQWTRCVLFPLMVIVLESLSESPMIARRFTKSNPVPPELLKLEDSKSGNLGMEGEKI